MPDILHEVIIDAPPDKVYQALTEQSGLTSWWTVDAVAKPELGSVSEFGFFNRQVLMQMEVAKLDRGRNVQWKPLSGVPDWPGTRVTWDLTPTDQGTKLLFGHRDFASADGSLPTTSYNWAWYLISLKKYIETGTGNPHTNAPGT
jgi:uncharacterized protein YndB with AHSA1/START domain